MTPFAINGILIAITCFPLAILIALNSGRDLSRWLLAWFTFSVSIWGLGGFFIGREQDPDMSLFWWRLTHVGVIMIPAFLLHFVYTFLKKQNRPLVILGSYLFAGVIMVTNLTGDFIQNVRYVFGQFYYDSPPTLLYFLFTVYFVLVVIVCHYWLIKAYLKGDASRRPEILYVLLGTGLGFAGGTPSFLPVYQIDLYPVLNFSVPLFPSFIAMAVFRYNLLNMKVLTTQLLVFATFVILFFELFFSASILEAVRLGGILVLFLYFGHLLVQNVAAEVHRREELQRLSEQLKASNEELAKRNQEIKEANEKLIDLDKAKSEFISIASHQLRTPMTIIKGYLSLIMEGQYGKTNKKMRETIEKLFESSNRLIALINDLLNISRIESGRMVFDLKPLDINAMVAGVVDEHSLPAKNKNLKLEAKLFKKTVMVNADSGKLREVIFNLVDNSIKYTEKGFVRVGLTRTGDEIMFEVKDSGVGIDPKDIGNLFQKFVRGSLTLTTVGTGLGLFVCRKIIEAHGGTIKAESAGKGKGSRFYFTIKAIK